LIKNRRKIYQDTNIRPTGNDLKNLKPIGITIPFDNPNGIFTQTYTNIDQVIQNIRNLLKTNKGERIMQPEFGTDIQYYLFEPITDEESIKSNIIGEIRSSFDKWLPYVKIHDARIITDPRSDARFSDSRYAVVITINLFITGTNIYAAVALGITESGNLEIM
jgi:phage baseplate assembly protein W